MSLNIGTLAAYLTLDDTNFTRKADQADRKLSALQLHLDALSKSNPKVRLEVQAQTEKIDEIKAKITALRADMAKGLDVKVEMVQALVDLDRVQTKVRELHNKTIRVDVDNKDALAKLDAIDAKAKASSAGLGGLGTGLLALGPALIPITGAVAGLTAALSVPLVTAGGGLTLFGLLAGKQIQNTNTVATQLKALEKTAQTATTASARNKAVSQYTALYKTLSGAQLQFISNEAKLRSAFGGLTTDQSMFGPINKGVEILTSILPKLRPLLDATGGALDVVLGKVQTAVKSGEFDRFIAGFSKLAGPSIHLGLDTLGQFGKGLIGLGAAFGPLGIQFLTGLDHMATSFAKWGANSSQNQGVQAFIGYVKREGPAVAATLGHVVVALMHIGAATAPWGDTVLRVLDLLAKGISAIPTPLLTPLVTGLLGVNLALKGMKAIGGLEGLGNGLMFIGAMTENGGQKLAAFGGGLTNVSKRLSESKLAMASFGAGLAGIAASSTSSSSAVNILGDTASGALMGFGVAGPIGAAVGGLAGLLGGSLIAGIKGSGDAFHAAKADVDGWANAINQGLQAGDAFARQQVLNDFQKNPKLLAGLRSAGFSVPQIVSGTMNGGLSAQVGVRLSNAQTKLSAATSAEDAWKAAHPNDGEASGVYSKQLNALINQSNALSDQVKLYKELDAQLTQYGNDAQAAAQKAWTNAQGTAAYGAALSHLPKDVQTRINALDIQPTTQAVINLAAKYHATPKEVQTYLHTLGVDESLRQIAALIAAANRASKPIIIPVHFLATVDKVTATVTANLFGAKPHARGGKITGPGTGTSDSIPAMLSSGEFVMNARATAVFGPVLEAMNAKHFAAGGYAGLPTPAQLSASLPPLKTKAKKSKIRRIGGQTVAAIDSRALSAITSALSKTASQLSAAHSWAASIAGNPFSANLVGPATTTSMNIGGIGVKVNNAGQPITASSSNSDVLAAMMAYQANQYKTGHQLMSDIQVLRKKGVSNAVLAQMQSAGAQGVQEIHALASAPAATVRKFNQVQANITSTLDNAGAYATSGQSYPSLQHQQVAEQNIAKGIRKAAAGGIPVVVVGTTAHPQLHVL